MHDLPPLTLFLCSGSTELQDIFISHRRVVMVRLTIKPPVVTFIFVALIGTLRVFCGFFFA